MVGCYTGLRVSDYSRLTPEHITSYQGTRMFKVQAIKTGKTVQIPIHPIVEQIMDRYGRKPPPYQADQIINRHLKELGFLAGLNDPIRVTRTQGGTPHIQTFLKHEMIKSHTARRSFCTNAYLAGLDCLDIMAISGHKTESAFLKYIKVSQEERAKRIAGHAFFAL